MQIINFSNFFDDLGKTILEYDYLLFVLIGCSVLLIILIILAFAFRNAKNTPVNSETKLIKQTLLEETPAEEAAPVEEVVEETPVEEAVPVEEVVEEAPVEETPAEEAAPMEETPVEEEATEPSSEQSKLKKKVVKKTIVNKTIVKKAAATKSEEPVKEETTVEEVVEETPVVEEKTTAKQRVVNGKYEVFFDGTSYFYTLKASNGEVLIKSESYASRDSVLAAIEAIKRNISVGSVVIREDKHGLYQFVLVAKNHRTLVMSANYKTAARAQSASQSFKRFAETSPVIEIAEQVESNKEEINTSEVVSKQGGKIGVLSDEKGFYYILKASNGEVLVHSDYFKLETSAVTALERFKETVNTGKFYLVKDKSDNYQFKLYSPNGRIVCVGEIYSSKSTAISSALSVCSFVELATPIAEN